MEPILDEDGRVTDVNVYKVSLTYSTRRDVMDLTPEYTLEWSFSSEKAAWETLPLPVLDHIMSFLWAKDQVRMTRVCKGWHRAAEKIPSVAEMIKEENVALNHRIAARKESERQRKKFERQQRFDRFCSFICGNDCCIMSVVFLLPGLLQLAMGVTGLVYFSNNVCSRVASVGCSDICTGLFVVDAFFLLNFLMFCLLFLALWQGGYKCKIKWQDFSFMVLNSVGVLSNLAIVGGGATMVNAAFRCDGLPDVAYEARAYGGVAVAVGAFQFLLGLFFAWAFKDSYRNILVSGVRINW